MSPRAARTLWEWVPGGTSRVARRRGAAGSPTSTSVLPWGAFMWAMNATRPSTTTWPPPGQSKYATCFSPRAEAVDDGACVPVTTPTSLGTRMRGTRPEMPAGIISRVWTVATATTGARGRTPRRAGSAAGVDGLDVVRAAGRLQRGLDRQDRPVRRERPDGLAGHRLVTVLALHRVRPGHHQPVAVESRAGHHGPVARRLRLVGPVGNEGLGQRTAAGRSPLFLVVDAGGGELRLEGRAGGEREPGPGRLRRGAPHRKAGGVRRHLLQRRRQRADERDARHRQDLAHLLHAELGSALGDRLGGRAGGPEEGLVLHHGGDAQALEHAGEVDAARGALPRVHVGERSHGQQRLLEGGGRP